MSSLQDFIRRGGRLAARELITAQNPALWNSWRQQTDMFGDQVARRVNLAAQSMRAHDLRGYDLTNVNAIKSDFSECILAGVNCSYSDFLEANFIEAKLADTNFRHARLARAYLRDADLCRSDLRDCDFRRASLTGAQLVQANLCGCDLSSTRGLVQEQLEDAVGDRKTRLPPHLLMPAAWAVYDAEPPEDTDDVERLRTLPATVEVAIISGRVQLSSDPGNAYFAGTTAVEPLLGEITSDLQRVGARCANVRELSTAIDAYLQEAQREGYDIILLGMRGIKLQTILEAVDRTDSQSELLPDAVGALRAVIIQHQLFIGQSHKWKRFLEEADRSPLKPADADIARNTGLSIIGVTEQHVESCDPRVPTALRRVIDEVSNTGSNSKLTIVNAVSSAGNYLRSLTMWVFKEAKRFLGDAWETCRTQLSRIVGTGMAALVIATFSQPALHALSTLYPAQFGYLKHLMKLLGIKAE